MNFVGDSEASRLTVVRVTFRHRERINDEIRIPRSVVVAAAADGARSPESVLSARDFA